jgi:hypothetical protein
MSKLPEMNGPARKTLASQLDRLDAVLDSLSEGLNDARWPPPCGRRSAWPPRRRYRLC